MIVLARGRWKTAGVALVIFIAVGATVLLGPRGGRWAGASLGAQRVIVTPFIVKGNAAVWDSSSLEDSIAVRLGADPQLVALAGREAADADYVLEGTVSPDGDRLVIVVRLRPPGQRTATWTATFWRKAVADSSLATDLAFAVSEALRVNRR